MRNLVIMPTENRERMNLGEFAEEATIIEETATPKRVNHFIEANTQEATLQHLKNDCITPVFAKDNELTVNHAAFIETVWEAANSYYNGETIETPDIRVSHVIKGRIPEAIHKPANQLLESDKTIYYERAAFSIDIPTIYETVEGNKLNLSIVGVRAYNQMNLYSKKKFIKRKVIMIQTLILVITDWVQFIKILKDSLKMIRWKNLCFLDFERRKAFRRKSL